MACKISKEVGTDLAKDLTDLGGSDEIPLSTEHVLLDLFKDIG